MGGAPTTQVCDGWRIHNKRLGDRRGGGWRKARAARLLGLAGSEAIGTGGAGRAGQIQPWYHMWASQEEYGMGWAVSSGYK